MFVNKNTVLLLVYIINTCIAVNITFNNHSNPNLVTTHNVDKERCSFVNTPSNSMILLWTNLDNIHSNIHYSVFNSDGTKDKDTDFSLDTDYDEYMAIKSYDINSIYCNNNNNNNNNDSFVADFNAFVFARKENNDVHNIYVKLLFEYWDISVNKNAKVWSSMLMINNVSSSQYIMQNPSIMCVNNDLIVIWEVIDTKYDDYYLRSRVIKNIYLSNYIEVKYDIGTVSTIDIDGINDCNTNCKVSASSLANYVDNEIMLTYLIDKPNGNSVLRNDVFRYTNGEIIFESNAIPIFANKQASKEITKSQFNQISLSHINGTSTVYNIYDGILNRNQMILLTIINDNDTDIYLENIIIERTQINGLPNNGHIYDITQNVLTALNDKAKPGFINNHAFILLVYSENIEMDNNYGIYGKIYHIYKNTTYVSELIQDKFLIQLNSDGQYSYSCISSNLVDNNVLISWIDYNNYEWVKAINIFDNDTYGNITTTLFTTTKSKSTSFYTTVAPPYVSTAAKKWNKSSVVLLVLLLVVLGSCIVIIAILVWCFKQKRIRFGSDMYVIPLYIYILIIYIQIT